MDSPVDRVENASRTYVTPDEVKPLSQAAPEKERKFASALKEKMEEELGRRKRRSRKDEAIIDHEESAKDDAEQDEVETESGSEAQVEETKGENDDSGKPLVSGQVDLKG
jgi:hypothetical protein